MHFITSTVILMGILSGCPARPTFDVIADIIHDLVHDPNHPADHGDPNYMQTGSYAQNGVYNRPFVSQGAHSYNGPYVQELYPHGGGYNTPSTQQYSPNSYGSGSYGHRGNAYDRQGYYQGPPYRPNANGDGIYSQQGNVYDRQGYYQGPPYHQNANGYIQNNNGYRKPPQYGYKDRGY